MNFIVIRSSAGRFNFLTVHHTHRGGIRVIRKTATMTGMAPGRRRGRSSQQPHQRVLDALIGDASGVLQSVANGVAPAVVGAIDVNGVVERVDIQAVAERVDIQGIVDRVDLQEVLARVDLNVLLEGIDLDAVLARADLNSLLARVDINAIVEQLDVEAIIDRVDINAVLARVDLDTLVERTEVGSIIAAAGAGIASKAIDVARSQGVGLDFLVQRWTDRLLRRRPSPRAGGPVFLLQGQKPSLP